MMKNWSVLCVLFLLMVLSPLSAAVLVNDNFTGVVGTALDANGWVCNAGQTYPVTITSPGLSYPGYVNSGIGNSVTTSSTGSDYNLGFTPVNSGSVYAACMLNISSMINNNSDYLIHLGNASGASPGTSLYGRIVIQKNASGLIRFGICKTTSTLTPVNRVNFTDYVYYTGTTYLLVMKIRFVAGASNDIVSLFINPALTANEPAPTLTSTLDTVADVNQLASFCIRQGSNTPIGKLDGVRVCTTWSEMAIPPMIATTGSLSAFRAGIGQPSAAQSYMVSCANLTSSVEVTAPAGFELSSAADGPYEPALILITDYNGQIYVRLTGSAAGTFSGNIMHSSTGATTNNLPVSGAVTCVPQNLTATANPTILGRVLLSWNPPVSGTPGSYRVYRQSGSDPAQMLLQANVLSGTDRINTPSRYWVTAMYGTAESAPTDTILFVPASNDTNDNLESATSLGIPVIAQPGNLFPATDVDCYSFYLGESLPSYLLEISTNCADLAPIDLKATLYGPYPAQADSVFGNEIAATDDNFGGNLQPLIRHNVLNHPGYYYLLLEKSAGYRMNPSRDLHSNDYGYYELNMRLVDNLVVYQIINAVTTEEDTSFEIDLAQAFYSPDGDVLQYTFDTAGHFTVDHTGSLYTFTPLQNWNGADSVLVTASDLNGSSVSQSFTVTVNPVNDPPFCSDAPALLSFYENSENTSLQLNNIFTDVDGEILRYSYTGNNHIRVTIVNGAVTLHPETGWVGQENITFTAIDAVNESASFAMDVRVLPLNHDLHLNLPASIYFNMNDGFSFDVAPFVEGAFWPTQTVSVVTTTNLSHTVNGTIINLDSALDVDFTEIITIAVEDTTSREITTGTTTVHVISQGTGVSNTDVVAGEWDPADSPFYILSGLNMEPESTLTIAPEVVVSFLYDTPFEIQGNLQADQVTFSAPEGESWGGLQFGTDSDDSQLTNCTILNALQPIQIDGSDMTVDGCTLTIDSTLAVPGSSAIQVTGDSSPVLTNLHIAGYNQGIFIDNPGARTLSTPTLTNIRIRNSNNSSRMAGIGISLRGEVSADIDSVEIDNYDTAIELINHTRALSTPTLTNIRVRNSSNSSRTDSYGIDIQGAVLAQISNAEIDSFSVGIRYIGNGTNLRTTPTLTNIRIRNSSSSSRNAICGIYLENLDYVNVLNDTIDYYPVGIRIVRSDRALSTTPTLTNIRIRNSSGSTRNSGIGLDLNGCRSGDISNVTVDDYNIGINLSDGNRMKISGNILKNCSTGLCVTGADSRPAVERNQIYLNDSYFGANPGENDWGISAEFADSLIIRNNTIYGYHHAMRMVNAEAKFIGNIFWAGDLRPLPFDITASSLLVKYSDVRTAGVVYEGIGNIASDPHFADEINGDFHLSVNSPCIDTGDPAYLQDEDDTRSDMGAIPMLHRANFQVSHRFITPGEIVMFTNQSLGHEPALSQFFWDFNNDGLWDSFSSNPSYEYISQGYYTVKFKVTTGALADSLELVNYIVVQDIALLPPQNLQVSANNNNLSLSWSPVTQTTQGLTVTIDYYLIYSSETPDGRFTYLAQTDGQTQFTHLNVLSSKQKQFYFIIGYQGTRNGMQQFVADHRSIDSGNATKPLKDSAEVLRK